MGGGLLGEILQLVAAESGSEVVKGSREVGEGGRPASGNGRISFSGTSGMDCTLRGCTREE